MDWNLKWDWESFDGFGSKATESPKKLQLVDWTIVDDGEINGASFNLSNSGPSASDGGHVSSAKSSLSASTDSQIKTTEVSKTYPHLEASMGSAEQLIGLKLGKRTYFENNVSGGNVKSASIPAMPTPSTTALKKTKSSGQNISTPHCVVEGCKTDLSTAKMYHQKHRVCDIHSKCPKVIVGGLERRFCQQCSRFHNLSEFDDEKRSCRKRLSDHNARRRKPQQGTVQFNSARQSLPFYGERKQLSFLLNDSPLFHSRNSVDTTWDSTQNPKFTLTTGHPIKSTGERGISESMRMPGIKLPHVISMNDTAQPLMSRNSVPGVLNPGSRGSHMDGAPEYGRALSLLSNNNWGPYGPETLPLHENVSQAMMHTIPEGVTLSSPELWHQSLNPFVSNSNFHETQLLANPYEAAELYSQLLN